MVGTEYHKARNGKGIAGSEFIKLPEKRRHCKSAARNAAKIWVKWKTLCIE